MYLRIHRVYFIKPYLFHFQKIPIEDGLEDGIELENRKSRKDRRSKSCSGSPIANAAYLKSKTVTAFVRTELHYKERSFHKNDPKSEETLKKFRRAISSPNLPDMGYSSEKNINLITEVHVKRNDFTLKVIT